VEDVVSGGASFLEHETTLQNYRKQYHQADVLIHLTLSQWLDKGEPDAALEAQHRAEELVKQHEFEAPKEILNELRAIYDKGKERLHR